ncbi:Hypothetical protein NTJ_04317 [Nesidiocoris tenuis]|uniref:Uncharacterized protein n=1 Tax=Nesidiocoris tenuis TaxID=355587 RepID=A0ABN7AGZ5_9HEMI|nr:Hypothetical protein NTJ_04317 [Nesidiocoris tenuis]
MLTNDQDTNDQDNGSRLRLQGNMFCENYYQHAIPHAFLAYQGPGHIFHEVLLQLVLVSLLCSPTSLSPQQQHEGLLPTYWCQLKISGAASRYV